MGTLSFVVSVHLRFVIAVIRHFCEFWSPVPALSLEVLFASEWRQEVD